MAYVTQPNVLIPGAAVGWTLVAEGAANITLQLLSVAGVRIALAATVPTNSFESGHVLQSGAGRDSMALTDITTEKVYARVLANPGDAVLAVTKG
ncbi:hypothetical protein [Aureimonas sp. SA4125]|uniref:hypothetical protein n=1 Tax=Aureimonas sp. SA4125 TaxID=2826993 RepID=UPI001CC45893|nr:hypothetical protein [Aureimonas sp. SA4125]